jgi:hypothetical protein
LSVARACLYFWWLDETRRSEAQTDLISLVVQILFGGGTLLAIVLFTRALTQPDKTTPDVISFAIRRAAEQGNDSLTPVTTIANTPAPEYGEGLNTAVSCQWSAKPAWWESPVAKLVSIVLFQLFLLVGFIQSLNIRAIPFFFFSVLLIYLVGNFVVGRFRERSEISYIVADAAGLHGREYPRSPNKTLLLWNQIISFTASVHRAKDRARRSIR